MAISADVIAKAKAGDQTAFTELYSQTYKQAFAFARQIIKNRDDVDDILQDSYLTALNKLNTLQDDSKFQSWFNMIVANNCRNYLKKKKPVLFSEITPVGDDGEELELEIEDKENAFSPDKDLDYSETKRMLREIIDSLPEEQSMCVLMYYVQDMSIAEIAQSLGISENTVKSRLNYGRKKMKTEVEKLEKKGTKLYGLSGLALIPFLRWMFNQGEASSPASNILSKVLSSKGAEAVADTVAATAETASTVTDGAEAADTVATVVKGVAKAGGKHLALKVASGVTAAAVATTGGAMVATNSGVNIEDYMSDTVICDGVSGYASTEELASIIDMDALEAALCGNDEENLAEYEKYCSLRGKSIADYIDIDFDETGDNELSNGDKIAYTMNVNYDAINNMDGISKKLKGEDDYSSTVIVEGMREVIEIDIFSVIESLIFDCTVDEVWGEVPLSYSLVEPYSKDYGPVTIYWEKHSDYAVRFYFSLPDEMGEDAANEYEGFIRFDIPDADAFIPGDTITAALNVLDGILMEPMSENTAKSFAEYGFVFSVLEKELPVSNYYDYLHSKNFSQEDFAVLKNRAIKQAEKELAQGHSYKSSILCVEQTGGGAGLDFVFASDITSEVWVFRYNNLIVDQNGRIREVEKQTPTMCSAGLSYTFDTIEDYYNSTYYENPIIIE